MKKSLLVGSFIYFSLPIISMETDIESTYFIEERDALFTAFDYDDIQEMKNLLESNQSLANSTDDHDRPILNYTVKYSSIDYVQLLIDYGADVNKIERYGPQNTALSVAFSSNNPFDPYPITDYLEKAKLLIKHGAQVNKKIDLLLYYCIHLKNAIPILEFLLENNANINPPNSDLLHDALSIHNPKLLPFLLEKGADPNIQEKRSKNTPLHIAASLSNFIATRLLLQYGANRHIKNHDGRTPLDLANAINKNSCHDLFEVIRLLKEKQTIHHKEIIDHEKKLTNR